MYAYSQMNFNVHESNYDRVMSLYSIMTVTMISYKGYVLDKLSLIDTKVPNNVIYCM